MNKHHGFTLIEAIIVVVILGVLGFFASNMLGNGFTAYFNARDMTQAVWQGRLAMERMSRELNSGLSSGLTTTSVSIVFSNTDGETVTIDRNTGTNQLRLQVDATQKVLSDNTTSLLLTYLDEDAATTATIADIRYITPEITVTKGDTTASLRTTIAPRNIP